MATEFGPNGKMKAVHVNTASQYLPTFNALKLDPWTKRRCLGNLYYAGISIKIVKITKKKMASSPAYCEFRILVQG